MELLNQRFRRPPKSEGGPFRPYLDVTYTNPHTGLHFRTQALIDTGADSCVLPKELADLLGHNFNQGYESGVTGATGGGISYRHTVTITIPGFKTSEVLVNVMEGLTVPLLGVSTFLNHFLLEIDYPNQRFSLKKEYTLGRNERSAI